MSHENLDTLPPEEEQEEKFRIYLGKNLFKHLEKGKFPSRSDLLLCAEEFLDGQVWGSRQTKYKLVQMYYREKAKRAAESKIRNAEYEEQKKLKAEEAARQGDLFKN